MKEVAGAGVEQERGGTKEKNRGEEYNWPILEHKKIPHQRCGEKGEARKKVAKKG